MAVVGWGSVASFVTRQSLRRAAAAAALLWLASCGRDPYVAPTYGRIDEWRTEQHLDRTTGAPVSNSVILTRKVSTGSMLIAPPALSFIWGRRSYVWVEIALGPGRRRGGEGKPRAFCP